MREHLQTVERATGKRPAALEVPELPALAADVWAIFLDIRRRCGGAGFGPSPIDERRVLDWQRLYGQALTPWEIEAVFALDALWLRAQADEKETAD